MNQTSPYVGDADSLRLPQISEDHTSPRYIPLVEQCTTRGQIIITMICHCILGYELVVLVSILTTTQTSITLHILITSTTADILTLITIPSRPRLKGSEHLSSVLLGG